MRAHALLGRGVEGMKARGSQSTAYICELTIELAKMAQALNQPALALLLEMAALEADQARKPKDAEYR